MAQDADPAAAGSKAEETISKDPDNDELLSLSQNYQIPPSPSGTDTIPTHFGNGTLGDIMAAEFRDPTLPRPAANGSHPGADSDADAANLESPDQGGADHTLLRSAIGLPPSINVNEIESQPLGHSILGADELYTAATFGDGETHSRQRILSFAAKRCAKAVQNNPQDYDALYNWALVLQETADGLDGNPSADTTREQLLEEACAKYKAATDLCPTMHEAFYNWAIAISDRAKARGRTKEAEELWKEACKRYDKAVQLSHNNPQALNNWGLALQELSSIVSIKEKKSTVKSAVKKFRAAISLQFDFHRAIYNLGTVLYGLAEDLARSGDEQPNKQELSATDLYSQSAIYVATAHALKPEYPVYKSALRLVRSKLPLAYLKTGYLSAPPQIDSLAPHSDWKRLWVVLDHEALYQVDKNPFDSSEASPRRGNGVKIEDDISRPANSHALRIEISDLCGVFPCADLSLPQGACFCIDTVHGPTYLMADTWEEVDCWVDAVRCVFAIYSRGQSDILGGIIAG